MRSRFSGVKCSQNGGGVGNAAARAFGCCGSAIVRAPQRERWSWRELQGFRSSSLGKVDQCAIIAMVNLDVGVEYNKVVGEVPSCSTDLRWPYVSKAGLVAKIRNRCSRGQNDDAIMK